MFKFRGWQVVEILLLALLCLVIMIYAAPAAGVIEAQKNTVVISFVGDVTLGQDYYLSPSERNFQQVYAREGVNYFFSRVRHIFAASDVVVANLEGVLLSSNLPPINKPGQGKKFYLSGSSHYTQILLAGGIGLVNLANNHTLDFAAAGLAQTQRALKAAGIAYFGREKLQLLELGGIKVGFYGLTLGTASTTAQQRAITTLQHLGAELIVANFHGGPEGVYYPSAAQKQAAATALKLGARVVIGHHAHVLQGVKTTPHGIVAYGLGNFCFGGNRYPSDTDSMIFQVLLRRSSAGQIEVSQRIVPVKISSNRVYNNYCPQPLEGKDKQRVLDKIAHLSEQL